MASWAGSGADPIGGGEGGVVTGAPVSERVIDAGGLGLAVVEAGAGGAPLLLVHGWTGAKEDFDDWIGPIAAEGWHVVAPDLRGHGASAKPGAEDDHSFELLAGDLLALADSLGWDRFALIGHSMGGMVAQHLALRAGVRIAGLVLMDTHHGPLELDPAVVQAGIDAARTVGTGAIADLMVASSGPGPLDTEAHLRLCRDRPGYAERGPATTRATSAAAFAALLAEIAGGRDRLDDLTTLRMPVLVLVGEQDEPFLAASRRMTEVILGAELAVVPDAGHSPQFEAPSAWWAALAPFLRSLDGAPEPR